MIKVHSLYVDNVRKADIDSSVDAVSAGIIAGTGAFIDNELTSKARIFVSPGATVEARSIRLDSRNTVEKDRYGAGDGVNLATVSLSIAGGAAGQTSHTNIGTSVQPLTAAVIIQPGAVLRATGTYSQPGTLGISTLTDIEAIDRTSVLQISGASGAVVANGLVRSDTNSRIDIDGAILENQYGAIELGSRGNAYAANTSDVEVAAGISAAMGSTSNATNINKQEINLSNAHLEASNILVMAGRDLSRTSNVINSVGVAEAFLASLFPNFPDPMPSLRSSKTIRSQWLEPAS